MIKKYLKKYNYFKIMDINTYKLKNYIFTTEKKAQQFCLKYPKYIVVACNVMDYTNPYNNNPTKD